MFVLPKPDITTFSSGPTGWDSHPGGNGFPLWLTNQDAGSPTIGLYTELTKADETMAIVGEDMLDAEFVAWAEGMVFYADTIRTAEDRAQVTIPETAVSIATATEKAVPDSMFLVWGKNAAGFGRPVRVNAPEIFWIWPGTKWTTDADSPIRIFGKGLFVEGFKPVVVIKKDSDDPVYARVELSSPIEMSFMPTRQIEAGSYQVWVHNGTGGLYGWSNVGTFTAAVKAYNTAGLVVVDDQVGATDQLKIEAAIAVAGANGGGTVVFSAKTYSLTTNLNVSTVTSGAPPIILKGAGRDLTIITGAYGRTIQLCGAGSEIRDMKLNEVTITIRDKDQTIDNIELSADRGYGPLDMYHSLMSGGAHAGQNVNLTISNSIIRAVECGIQLGTASYIHIHDCEIYGRYYDGVYNAAGTEVGKNHDNNGIGIRGCHKVLIEDCIFEAEDALNGRLLTRAIAVLRGNESCLVIKNNTCKWIGAFPSSPDRALDTGECLLFHGEDAGMRGPIDDTPTNTTISVTIDIDDFDDYVTASNQFYTYDASYIARG
jgi:hypothetical protein